MPTLDSYSHTKQTTMKTIFVEDTESHRDTLREMIKLHCPQLQLLGDADSIDSGYDLIIRTKPELVFLDVELYTGTSFDLLNRLQASGNIDFDIIFLTGNPSFEYPVRAIQYAALDFLTKPLDAEKLKEAVERAEKKFTEKQNSSQYKEQIALLLHNLMSPPEKKSKRIAFHRSAGQIEFVSVDDIVYCEADRDVTHIFLMNGKNFAAMRHLAQYAQPLEIDFNFFRISDKHLVNLDHVTGYNHKDNLLTLVTGQTLSASRRGGRDLKEHFNKDTSSSSESEATILLTPEVETSVLKSLLKKLLGG